LLPAPEKSLVALYILLRPAFRLSFLGCTLDRKLKRKTKLWKETVVHRASSVFSSFLRESKSIENHIHSQTLLWPLISIRSLSLCNV
jgi:hypothetical protein